MRSFDPRKNYYEIIGVSQNAGRKEIERAYRTQAKKRHPDAGGCEDEMKLLNEAYEVLNDPVIRKAYETGRKGIYTEYGIDIITNRPDSINVRPEASGSNRRFQGLLAGAAASFVIWLFFLESIGDRRAWLLRTLSTLIPAFGVFLAHSAIRLKQNHQKTTNAPGWRNLFLRYEGILLATGFGIFVCIITLIYVK